MLEWKDLDMELSLLAVVLDCPLTCLVGVSLALGVGRGRILMASPVVSHLGNMAIGPFRAVFAVEGRMIQAQ